MQSKDDARKKKRLDEDREVTSLRANADNISTLITQRILTLQSILFGTSVTYFSWTLTIPVTLAGS
jgi:hypothetical protein